MNFVESTPRTYVPKEKPVGNFCARSFTPMQFNPEELKAHLMETDQEFRRLATQHCEYKKQIEALASKPYLTPEQQLEESRIKKLKLRLKDQMQEIIDRYRHAHQMA
jgi:uncharacterized protein YdcH (DUF465 family)